MNIEWLTINDVATMTKLKPSTIHKYRVRKVIPQPDRYIGRTPVWKEQTIQTWITSRTEIEETI